jgi:hypothetical protein
VWAFKVAFIKNWAIFYTLFFPLPPPEYAQVIKMLGNGRLEAMCFDGVKRLCHIRGKLRKKVSVGICIYFILYKISWSWEGGCLYRRVYMVLG